MTTQIGMKMKQGYLIVTLGFAISLSVHWIYAWFAYLDDAKEHNQPIQLSNYFNMNIRDTMENWQSQFLQLAWQIGGLSLLWAVASPQSKSETDRVEEKIDLLLKKIDPKNSQKLLKELETKYPKK
jgi:Domain of unknown function (DUF6766)